MSKEFWKGGNMLYPLPVVMVSLQRENEKPNIITVAWAGTVCSNPPMISISVRKERYSYEILKETGEFVINLTTKDLARATDYCGVKSGRDVDKFKACNLTCGKAKYVKAPYIKESPVALECKVKEVLDLGSHTMFISEVLGVIIDNAFMDKSGKFALNSANLITYSHGEYYTLGESLGKFGFSVEKKK